MIKVALIGAHGVGKTTAALELAARLREEFPTLKTAILPEVARKCPWPVNRKAGPGAQRWIFLKQLISELESAAAADVLICDRSGLDNLVYARSAADCNTPGDWSFIEPAQNFFLDAWLTTYRQCWWFRPAFPLAADGFRDPDPKFQADIDAGFDRLLTGLRLTKCFPPWPGLEEALNQIRGFIIGRRLENILAHNDLTSAQAPGIG